MNATRLIRTMISVTALLSALSCQRPDVARIELDSRVFVPCRPQPITLPRRVIGHGGGVSLKREIAAPRQVNYSTERPHDNLGRVPPLDLLSRPTATSVDVTFPPTPGL